MHGNVWELVADCCNDTYGDAPSDGSAWTQRSCDRRSLRGGSWRSKPGYLRAAERGCFTIADYRSSGVGFRVARTLTP